MPRTVSFRIPFRLLRKLEEKSKKVGVTKTKILIACLEKYLDNSDSKSDKDLLIG